MAKVFVSYSRKDIEFAKRLTAELQKDALDFWIDWEGIPPTVDWWKEIEKGIEEADVFLFLISPDSAKSKICGQEIDTAVKNGKRIIPIVVREIEWQDTPPQLGHLNYIFFSRDDDFDTAVKKLMTAIQTDYEWAATHRRLQIKALDWERNNKDNGFLLRGMDLLDAEQDLATNTSKDPHPTDLQREYVLASRKATDRQRRILTSISIAAVIALATLAVFGFYQAGEATNNAATAQAAQVTAESNASIAQTAEANAETEKAKAEKEAKISRAGELAAQSIELRERDRRVSPLLAIEGFHSANTAQARKALLTGISDGSLIQFFALPGTEGKLITFSPDGKSLAIANQDYSITLWDLFTRKQIGNPLMGHHGEISTMTFSPDGEFLVSGGCTKPKKELPCSESEIIVWHIEKLQPVKNPLTIHEGLSNKLVFSSDGSMLALLETIQTDNYPWSIDTITFWEMRTYEQVGEPFHSDPGVLGITISPDNSTFAMYTFYSAVNIWDLKTREHKEELPVDADGLDAILFSPDGNTIIATDWNDYSPIILWDIKARKERNPDKAFLSYDGAVDSLALSPDGKILATALFIPSASEVENIGEITLWDVGTLKPIGKRLIGHKTKIVHMMFSRDGKTLISSGEDNTSVLWDLSIALRTQTKLEPLSQYLFTSTESIYSDSTQITYSPDGNILASSFSNKITLWDIKDRTPRPNTTNGTDFAFSKDGKMIASVNGGEITVENVDNSSSTVFRSTNSDSQPLKSSITLSSDGKILVSSHLLSYNPVHNEITFWDISLATETDPRSFQPISKHFMGNTDGLEIYSIALSPDGKIFATGTLDSKIILWNAVNHQMIMLLQAEYSVQNQANNISRLVFSSDGKILAAQYDGVISNGVTIKREVILWDVEKRSPIGLPFNGSGFAMSADGSTLATTASSNIIVLWDITTHQPIGQFAEPITDQSIFIQGLAFSPDGNTVASISSGSGSIILWDLNPESWIKQVCQQVGRNFTRLEWSQYFPDETYPTDQKEATCPQWPLEPEPTATPTP